MNIQAFLSGADWVTALKTIIQARSHQNHHFQFAGCWCRKQTVAVLKYIKFANIHMEKNKKVSQHREISVQLKKPTPGTQKQQNRQKLLDRTNLNTCKLLINDNARFSTEIAKIYKGQNFKSIFSLVFARKPGWKSACHNPAGIVIWSKKTNKKTNM